MCSPPTTSTAVTGIPTMSRSTGWGSSRPRSPDPTRVPGYPEPRRLRDLMSRAAELGVEPPDAVDLDLDTFGEPAARITTAVDVSGYLGAKREAMRAHSSQIAESSFFLSMPDEAFAALWGTEYYIRLGPTSQTRWRPLFWTSYRLSRAYRVSAGHR